MLFICYLYLSKPKGENSLLLSLVYASSLSHLHTHTHPLQTVLPVFKTISKHA